MTFSLFTSAAICLALSSSAFVCEIVRSGINAVAVGQAEAARAIGLALLARRCGSVILPQAFRSMVQPLVNVFIGVVLSSSLAAAVGVAELTNRTQQLNLQYAEAVPASWSPACSTSWWPSAGGVTGGPARAPAGDPAVSAERVLFDAPGPRARRRIAVATVLSVVVVAGRRRPGGLKQFGRPRPAGRRRGGRLSPRGPTSGSCGVACRAPLKATAMRAVLAFPIGALLALLRLSRRRAVRWLATAYVELFRAVPLLLLIYAFLLALPRYHLNLPIFFKLVIPIVMVSSAVIAEVCRAGVRRAGPRPGRGGARDRSGTLAGAAAGGVAAGRCGWCCPRSSHSW